MRSYYFAGNGTSRDIDEGLRNVGRSKSFRMIVGESGVGKTTEVLHNIEAAGHRNIIYCSVPSSGNPAEFEA